MRALFDWEGEQPLVLLFKKQRHFGLYGKMNFYIFCSYMFTGLVICPILFGLHADKIIVLQPSALHTGSILIGSSAGIFIYMLLPWKSLIWLIKKM